MLKEKIKEYIRNDVNNKKKTENAIFLIAILIVTILIINFILKGDKDSSKDENTVDTYKTLATAQNLQEDGENSNDLQMQLEKILKTIKGVGKVNVFISYSESSKTIAMYDEKTTTSSTEETDSSRRSKKYNFYTNAKRCNIFRKRWKPSTNDRKSCYAHDRRSSNYSSRSKKCNS